MSKPWNVLIMSFILKIKNNYYFLSKIKNDNYFLCEKIKIINCHYFLSERIKLKNNYSLSKKIKLIIIWGFFFSIISHFFFAYNNIT